MSDYKFDPFEEDGEEAFDNLDMDNEFGSLKDAIQDSVNAFETKYYEFTAKARHIISELNTALTDKCNEEGELRDKLKNVGDSPTDEMILPFLNKLAVLDYNVLKGITEQYVDEQGNPKVRDEAIVKALLGKQEVKKEPKPKKKSAEEVKQELAEVDKTIAEMKNAPIDEDANIKGLVGDDFQPTVNVPLQEPEKPKPSINDLF